LALWNYDWSSDRPGPRRPDPRQFQPAEQPPMMVPPPNAPVVMIHVDEPKRSSAGTAFSVDRHGVWITARHVTDGCDRIVLRTDAGRYLRVDRVVEQRNVDISLLWSRGGPAELTVYDGDVRPGQPGYAFGFPQGRPGDARGQAIGRWYLWSTGRLEFVAPVVAWAQIERIPDRGPNLAGISGGPWVDAEGRVVGVVIAGAPRRGRTYTTAPESLRAALARTDGTVSPRAAFAVNPTNFAGIGDRLRSQRTVSQVLCVVNSSRVRR
jgi:S1-C subfamily serine protease